jgi:hypothetical protein
MMPTMLQDRSLAVPTSRGGALSWQRMATLLEAEEQQQRALFVGRNRELALFRRALRETGTHILYVHGPGGIGKTSLLQAFEAEARRHSVSTIRIDARDVEPTLPSVLATLEAAGLSTTTCEMDDATRVVLLDSYEQIRAIEPLVFRALLRRVRSTTIVVIAGRMAPGAEWRALSLWGSAIVPIALRNLEPADATRYLERRGIRGEPAATICAFSHGHPLALALAADAWQGAPGRSFAPETAPDVIAALYEYFMRGVSEPEYCAALEVAGVLHTTSEAALGAVLECDAERVFAWLRDLSFMQMGSRGVFPHELAREVILAELRWRNPKRLEELILRAMRYYTELIRGAAEPRQIRDDYAYVIGHHPRLRIMLTHPDDGFITDGLRAGDEPVLRAAVLRHEGPTSEEHLRWWLHHQPSSLEIVRDAQGEPVAFAVCLRLDLTTEEQRAGDPVVSAAWRHALELMGEAPCGPMIYRRFGMACETYIDPSPALGILYHVAGRDFFLPDFTLRFVRVRESERRQWGWGDLATFAGARFEPALTHETEGRTYEVTIEDHRGVSGAEWLASMIDRMAAGDWGHPAAPAPRSDTSLVAALGYVEFGKQLRDALRALHDLVVLETNPLIHAQAVRARTEGAVGRERAAVLRTLLCEEAEALRGTARGDTWHLVLSAAYLNNPERNKHEMIADELGMSYSTFRRHLTAATQRLITTLWERERG